VKFYNDAVAHGNLCTVNNRSYALVFPGQGSQFNGMADAWTSHDASREVLAEASDVLGRDVVAGCRDDVLLATTEFVQPAMLACEVAAARVLEHEGFTFACAAGHSLGEFAALVAADSMTLADALSVVRVRGRAMQQAGVERPGTMSALLGVDASGAAALCDEVRGGDALVVANENAPQQFVISGSIAAIERAEALAASRKTRAVRLNVAGAFHSPLMEPAVAPIRDALASVDVRDPRFPIAENVVGSLVADAESLRDLLVRQVVSPVRWIACAQALADAGASNFLEAGPGDVLTKLAKRVTPGVQALAIGSPEAAAQAISSAP
jgi:[acyl-carrier-protein] S-malonyltransferase